MMNIKSVFLLALLFSSTVDCGPLIYRSHPVEMLTQIGRNAAAHLREPFAPERRVIQVEQSWMSTVGQRSLFHATYQRKEPKHDGQ